MKNTEITYVQRSFSPQLIFFPILSGSYRNSVWPIIGATGTDVEVLWALSCNSCSKRTGWVPLRNKWENIGYMIVMV